MAAPFSWSFTTAAANGPPTPTPTPAPTAYTVSVKDFGATGDGTTDDAPAIQAAIESLAATGGTVYVPAGDYRLGSSVVIDQNNITLTGQGAASVLQMLPDANDVSGILLPDQPLHNVTISDLVVDGNHNPITGISGQSGIWIRQASYVTLSGVIVRDWSGDGIQVANGSNPDDHVTIENSLITGIHRNGIHIGDATDTVIVGNHVADTPSQYWGGSAASSIDVEVEGDNQHGGGPVPGYPYVDNLLIKDNVLERQDSTTAGDGIQLAPAYGPISNVTIQGNLISNHQFAVAGGGAPGAYGNVSGLDHLTIADNWVDTPTMQVLGAGIQLNNGASNVNITGNVINDQSGLSWGAVDLTDAVNVAISGNTIAHTFWPFFAISLQGASDDITLADNTWENDPPGVQYLSVGSQVKNLTDDGGVPIARSAVDVTPPAVGFDIPDGTVISSPTPITVNASDVGTGVARVYFFVDGVPQGYSDAAPYVFSFDPSQFTAGPHVLEALAIDQFANPITASQVSVQVGGTPG
jgi:hypothetical protein